MKEVVVSRARVSHVSLGRLKGFQVVVEVDGCSRSCRSLERGVNRQSECTGVLIFAHTLSFPFDASGRAEESREESQGTPQFVQDHEQPSAVPVTIQVLAPSGGQSWATTSRGVSDPLCLDSDASRRLVLVGCVHPANISAHKTEVDLQYDDVGRRSAPFPHFWVSIRNAQHQHRLFFPASGGIQIHNSLSRNDEALFSVTSRRQRVSRIPIKDMVKNAIPMEANRFDLTK